MPNQKGGIIVDGTSHDDTIGGFGLGIGNLVSGNIGNGVTLAAGTDFISVVHNTIGFDASGQPLPNTGQQLVVDPGSTNDMVVGNVLACFAAGTRITHGARHDRGGNHSRLGTACEPCRRGGSNR